MTTIDTMGLSYRRAVRDRLDTWIRSNYESRAAFQCATGLDMSALRRCLNSADPQLPSGAILAILGAKTTLALDHLFTGEGPENRGELEKAPDLAVSLRAHLVNELQRRGVPVDVPQVFSSVSRRRGAIDRKWSSRDPTVLQSGKLLLRDVVRSMEDRVLQDIGTGVAHSYSLHRLVKQHRRPG